MAINRITYESSIWISISSSIQKSSRNYYATTIAFNSTCKKKFSFYEVKDIWTLNVNSVFKITNFDVNLNLKFHVILFIFFLNVVYFPDMASKRERVDNSWHTNWNFLMS